MKIFHHNIVGHKSATPCKEKRRLLSKLGEKTFTLFIDEFPERKDFAKIAETYSQNCDLDSHISITLKIGYSICHPDDKFSKKTGRSLAESNSKYVEVKVASVSFRSDGVCDVGFIVFDNMVNVSILPINRFYISGFDAETLLGSLRK